MAMPIRTWLLGLALLAGSGIPGCANDEPVAPGDEVADNLEARVVDSVRDESFVAPEKRPGQPPQTQPICGTRGAKPCGEGTFCDFAAGSQCGATDQGGRCVARPDACIEIYQPVCGCDGKTYGNACSARSAGVSVASEGRCEGGSDPRPPAGKMCGGIAGKMCGQGQYCNYAKDVGGTGCGVADGSGICQTIPQACTREYRPVCGCDGKTYGNKCTAAAAGASIVHDGECTTAGKTCGGLLGLQCAEGEFCNFQSSDGRSNDCGAADGPGVCQAKPEVCTKDYRPVCGCDDKTYGNRCAANLKGVSVLHDGACESDPGQGGVTCDPRQVLCRRAEPVCPAGQVASVQGSCWGPCVKLEACTCSQEDQCPHREQYVCHKSAGHCGPYVR